MTIERILEVAKEKGIKKAFLNNLINGYRGKLTDCKNGKTTLTDNEVNIIANYLNVSTDYLLGKTGKKNKPTITDEQLKEMGAYPVGHFSQVPIIGCVKAGFNGIAYQEHLGYETANVHNEDEYIFFKVTGDSMEAEIHAGDLALVHKQSDVESGEIAIAIVNGECGTIKKIIKKENAVVLQSFNSKYPPRILMGSELEELIIVGKVIETKRKW